MRSLCDCGRPVADAHACQDCVWRLTQALHQILGWDGANGPVHGLGVDLDIALMRLSKIGGGGGKRTGGAPLLFDPRAATARVSLRNTLVGWCRVAHEARGAHGASEGLPADALSAMAGYLLDSVELLRHHEAAGEAVRDITGAVEHALRIVDRPPDRWYAGMCGASQPDHDWCHFDLYAAVGAAVIQCPACGSTWDVAERRTWLLKQAEDVLAHAALIAQALSALGTPVTKVMIHRWAHGTEKNPDNIRLLSHGSDMLGRPLYRLGDVIDLAHEHAARVAAQKEKTDRCA